MTHDVAQVPADAETEAVENAVFSIRSGFTFLGVYGRSESAAHPASIFRTERNPITVSSAIMPTRTIQQNQRKRKLPRRHIEICTHRAVRVHNEIRYSEAERNSERGADKSDHQGIRCVVSKDSPILEAERLQRSDLCFSLAARRCIVVTIVRTAIRRNITGRTVLMVFPSSASPDAPE